MKTYLAIDVGYPNLLIGEMDIWGNILKYKSYSTGYLDQKQIVSAIKNAVDDYFKTQHWFMGSKPLAMGIVVSGRVDNVSGMWFQNDPAKANPVFLSREMSDIYDIPCFVENGVKAAVQSEKMFGAGRYSDNLIYISIGAEIAAGFIVNGELLRGSNFNAGEISHTNVGVGIGIACECGRTDCVNLIASGIGFDKSARFLSEKYKTTLVISKDEKEKVDIKDIFSLYKEGDELCYHLVENASSALANLIMNLMRVSDPDTVILGGGILSDGFLYPKILDKFNDSTVRFVNTGIIPTSFDNNLAGLIGAGTVAVLGIKTQKEQYSIEKMEKYSYKNNIK